MLCLERRWPQLLGPPVFFTGGLLFCLHEGDFEDGLVSDHCDRRVRLLAH